jgi:hypothetical protein
MNNDMISFMLKPHQIHASPPMPKNVFCWQPLYLTGTDQSNRHGAQQLFDYIWFSVLQVYLLNDIAESS